MLVIEVNRIAEMGTKTPISLHANQIAFIGDHPDKKAGKGTCVVAMSNGVVLHIDKSRIEIHRAMVAYT